MRRVRGGSQIGIDAVLDAVRAAPADATAHQVLDALVALLDAHTDTLGDDAAVVVVQAHAAV